MSGPSIGKAALILTTDAQQLDSGLAKAGKRILSFTSDLSAKITKIPSVPSSLLTGLVGEKMAEKIGNVLDKTKALKRAAEQTGIDPSQFSELAYAASKTGVDVEGLGTSLIHLEKNLSAAQSGAKDSQIAFAELGINWKQLDASDPHALVLQLADAFQGMSAAERASAAVNLFGRAGKELIPLLAKGSAGVKELENKAKDLGISLSSADFAKLKGANASMGFLKDAFEGIYTRLTVALAPAIDGVAQGITAFAPAIKPAVEYLTDLGDTAKWLAVTALEGIASWLDGLEKLGIKINSVKSFLLDVQDGLAIMIAKPLEWAGALPEGTSQALVGDSMKRASQDTSRLSDDLRSAAKALDGVGKSSSTVKDHLAETADGATKLHEQIQSAMGLLGKGPTETYTSQLEGLNSLVQTGVIGWNEYYQAVSKATDQLGQATGGGAMKSPTAMLAGSRDAVSAIIRAQSETPNDPQAEIKRSLRAAELQRERQIALGERQAKALEAIKGNTEPDEDAEF